MNKMSKPNLAKEERIKIFADTKAIYASHEFLRAAIKHSNAGQYFLAEGEVPKAVAEQRYQMPARVLVSSKRSFEAAAAYKEQHTLVLNFASASNPGGGVTKGSNAQEECLCRCSTLYANLTDQPVYQDFHVRHKELLKAGELDSFYNDDCIYTPDVVVFKTDTATPELMQEQDWFKVDVITCAAPNIRSIPKGLKDPRFSDANLAEIHAKRARRILDIAKLEGAEVVILGAFGCGAFRNPPQAVAAGIKAALQDYLYDFKVIEFAVYCSIQDMSNYQVFKATMQ